MNDLISRQAVLKLLSTIPPEEAMTKAMLIQSVKQMDAETVTECNNLISRQAAIDALEKMSANYGKKGRREWHPHIEECKSELRMLPSAQPEIIHCRDCKHWKTDHPTANGYHCCHRIHNIFPMREDDFCSRAERREE